MKTITLSPQGQITIPVALRRRLNLKGGTRLLLEIMDWVKSKALVIRPIPKGWVDEVAGSGRGLWGKNSDEYLQKERNTW